MRRFLLFVLLAKLVVPAVAQPIKTPIVLDLKAGKLLGVRTGNYAADEMIWIEGDRIKEVGKSADIQWEMRPSYAPVDKMWSVFQIRFEFVKWTIYAAVQGSIPSPGPSRAAAPRRLVPGLTAGSFGRRALSG
ncbi:MAG: hypothetical protein JO061_02800 [Acidobacteriaceae bacterium]|nr:hypothetical protein [Acidobacteriaceae bacterium]